MKEKDATSGYWSRYHESLWSLVLDKHMMLYHWCECSTVAIKGIFLLVWKSKVCSYVSLANSMLDKYVQWLMLTFLDSRKTLADILSWLDGFIGSGNYLLLWSIKPSEWKRCNLNGHIDCQKHLKISEIDPSWQGKQSTWIVLATSFWSLEVRGTKWRISCRVEFDLLLISRDLRLAWSMRLSSYSPEVGFSTWNEKWIEKRGIKRCRDCRGSHPGY